MLPGRERRRHANLSGSVRGDRRLPLTGIFKAVVDQLNIASDIASFYNGLGAAFARQLPPQHAQVALTKAVQALEVMVSEGWVTAKLKKKKPTLELKSPQDGGNIHPSRDDPDGR